MRKPTKKTLTNKLDKALSRKVRSKGYCERCGMSEYSKLQTAHIYSRTYRSVRWDRMNVLCLCASCHFYFHRNPMIFGDFVKTYLGRENYVDLMHRATAQKKWTIPEMQELLETLKNGDHDNDTFKY